MNTETQLEAAVQKVKALIQQVIQSTAQDIKKLTAADVGAAPASHTHISAVSVTIPTTGWGSDSTAIYPKYYDIAVTGATASDRASVDISTASIGTAIACGLCPAAETLAGKIRIRAASVPTAALTANYWIEKGT